MPPLPSRLSFDLSAIGLPEVPLFGRYRYREARDRLAPHTHEGCFEFCYLAEGSQVFGVDGRDYVMHPGDVFLTFPDEPHGSAGHPMERGSLYWFHLQDPRPGESLLGLSAAATDTLARSLRDIPLRCFPGGDTVGEPLAHAFRASEDARHGGNCPLQALRISAHLVQALLAIVDAAAQTPSRRTNSRMQRALDYMDTHVAERLTVEGIAEAVGLSPSWFKARFRREVGMPPAEYFLRRKVERALQLLANPSLTITRIAHRLGFSSSQHFAAVIRRYTGKTPKQCRLAATQPVPRGRFPSRNA